MPVAIDLDDDIHAVGNGRPVRADDGTADALVLGVVDHAHPRIVRMFFDELAAVLGAGVIHRVDHLDLGADGGNHVHHVARNLVARDGDGNAHGRHAVVEASATPAMISAPPASVRQPSGSPRKAQASVGTMRKARPMKG